MPEPELEENVTRIDFPRPIGEAEVDELIKYFVAQLDEQEGSRFSVSVNFPQNRHYGRMSLGEKVRMYESLNDVVINRRDTKIAGTITAALPALEAASFEFRRCYDRLDRPAFIGIEFHVTPGTQLGELKSDSVDIMRSMSGYVRSYFEESGKV